MNAGATIQTFGSDDLFCFLHTKWESKTYKRAKKEKMTEVVGVVTGLTTEIFEINQVSLAPRSS